MTLIQQGILLTLTSSLMFLLVYLLLKLEERKKRRNSPITLVWAEGLSEADINQLQGMIDQAVSDPDFIITTNYQVNWTQIPMNGEISVRGTPRPMSQISMNEDQQIPDPSPEDLDVQDTLGGRTTDPTVQYPGALGNALQAAIAQRDPPGEDAAHEARMRAIRATSIMNEGRSIHSSPSDECNEVMKELAEKLNTWDPNDNTPRSTRYSMMREKSE